MGFHLRLARLGLAQTYRCCGSALLHSCAAAMLCHAASMPFCYRAIALSSAEQLSTEKITKRESCTSPPSGTVPCMHVLAIANVQDSTDVRTYCLLSISL